MSNRYSRIPKFPNKRYSFIFNCGNIVVLINHLCLLGPLAWLVINFLFNIANESIWRRLQWSHINWWWIDDTRQFTRKKNRICDSDSKSCLKSHSILLIHSLQIIKKLPNLKPTQIYNTQRVELFAHWVQWRMMQCYFFAEWARYIFIRKYDHVLTWRKSYLASLIH